MGLVVAGIENEEPFETLAAQAGADYTQARLSPARSRQLRLVHNHN